MDYYLKYLKYKKKYSNLKQSGGESKVLQNILEIAKKQFSKEQFFKEKFIKDGSTKLEIFENIKCLPEHKTVSHTPIEANWKKDAIVTDCVVLNDKLIGYIYHTKIQLKKSATNKNLNEILRGLEENTIKIIFTWSSNFKLVFINFFTIVTNEESIEYVNNVYEPCNPDGNPIPEAPPYSYNHSTYNKPLNVPPYQIISREFTNQIYEWIGRGTLENFRCLLDTITDNSNIPFMNN